MSPSGDKLADIFLLSMYYSTTGMLIWIMVECILQFIYYALT